jgi:acyl carrier protein
MEIEKFVGEFAAQFEDTPPESFKADTIFRETAEWDSLIALSIIALADDEYSVKLTGDDIRSAVTINDIFEIIKAKKG